MSFLTKIFSSTKPGPNLLNPENLELWNRAEIALNRVRPMLHADGGDIELINAEAGEITVKLTGACSHCQSSTITMREGVERVLHEEIPELKKITLS